jgi:hypothetical protein
VIGTFLALDSATGGNASSAVASLGQKAGDALGGLFGGLTATDKKRNAQVDALAAQALQGNADALRRIERIAFEGKGDTAFPPKMRSHAKKQLLRLVSAGKVLSSPTYYERLSVEPPQNFQQQFLSAAGAAVVGAARPVLADEVRSATAATLRSLLPWIVGALLLGVVVYLVARKS